VSSPDEAIVSAAVQSVHCASPDPDPLPSALGFARRLRRRGRDLPLAALLEPADPDDAAAPGVGAGDAAANGATGTTEDVVCGAG